MSISKISGIYNQTRTNSWLGTTHYSCQPQSNIPISTSQNTKDIGIGLGICAAALAIGGIILHVIQSKRITKPAAAQIEQVQNVVLNSKPAEKIKDLLFKNKIVEALKKEGITCSTDSLKSIVGPEEFSELIYKFGREHFTISRQAQGLSKFADAKEFESFLFASQENLQTYYQNFANGKFRVTLHTHSNFSDGRATVSEFLEQARKYADHIASKHPNDGLPPFTIALTDHDTVEGCKEAIKIIAQNPELYKNLKFISGAELSVKNKSLGHFDVTALAVNPFDEGINKMLGNLRQARIKTVEKLLATYPKKDGSKYTFEDLIKWQAENKGKKDVERMAGVVSVRHAIDAFNALSGREIGKEIAQFDILPIKEVINTIHQANGKVALTHPLKSFWRPLNNSSLEELRLHGIDGIEAYHQYSPSNFFKLKEKNQGKTIEDAADEILTTYENYAKKHNLFLAGGTDSHRNQPFIYHPHGSKIDEFINSVINN